MTDIHSPHCVRQKTFSTLIIILILNLQERRLLGYIYLGMTNIFVFPRFSSLNVLTEFCWRSAVKLPSTAESNSSVTEFSGNTMSGFWARPSSRSSILKTEKFSPKESPKLENKWRHLSSLKTSTMLSGEKQKNFTVRYLSGEGLFGFWIFSFPKVNQVAA